MPPPTITCVTPQGKKHATILVLFGSKMRENVIGQIIFFNIFLGFTNWGPCGARERSRGGQGGSETLNTKKKNTFTHCAGRFGKLCGHTGGDGVATTSKPSLLAPMNLMLCHSGLRLGGGVAVCGWLCVQHYSHFTGIVCSSHRCLIASHASLESGHACVTRRMSWCHT